MFSFPVGNGAVTEDVDIAFMLELKKAVRKITDNYRLYSFSEGLKRTEDFFYKRFSDIYIELVKGRLKGFSGNNRARESAAGALQKALNILLRLFAPVMPFITEEVWSWVFAGKGNIASIHIAPCPGDRDFAAIPASHAHRLLQYRQGLSCAG